ncbi:MAG: hypothetical protein WA254_03885 [Candidatus Sulfotelmatobacter sp.]
MSDPQKETELAANEFRKMRGQILGELSPEALRHVAERRTKKEKQ